MMARWDSTIQLLTSMKFTITHVQRAPIKERGGEKKVLCLLSGFSAVTGLIHPDYFRAKPDRRDKGQNKFQSVKENTASE